MRSPRLPHGVALLLTASVGLALLHACQDSPKPTELESAVTAALRTLTVTGSGTGDGVVTSSPAGIKCTVTAGTAAATGCKAQFSDGVVVTLTAMPKSGHSFRGWFGSCAGTGTCKVSMTADRAVEARFLKGPFTIRISGGTTGAGSGTVKSQPGLTPAINCVITKGVAAATGCSALYPANTSLTLTATAAAANTFTGWGTPCTGTGTCHYTVIQSRTIAATFAPSGSGSAAVQGKWGAPFPTPVVAVHVHQLLTGKVLLWGDRGDAQLWDPASPGAGFTAVSKTYRIFCSGHTFLPDGRLLVTGGVVTGTTGDPRAVLFDPSSGAWSGAGSMAQGRYYPTTTALPSGEILVVSGNDENRSVVTIPEIGN